MTSIMPAFDDFPDEGAIVGRLLAGYGELELELCNCVVEAGNDFDMVFKAMFKVRGATRRIKKACAMGHEPYTDMGLGQNFEDAIGAIRYCLKIRNQYAHCYWTDNHGRHLGFVKLEDTAKADDPVYALYTTKASDIDFATLQTQEAYFVNTKDWLTYLVSEFKHKAGRSTAKPLTIPKKIDRPLLCKP